MGVGVPTPMQSDRGSRGPFARDQRSLRFLRSDWNAARREPQYAEDPARGTSGPLWGAAVPEWGRVGFMSCAEGEYTVGVWAENAEEGERT